MQKRNPQTVAALHTHTHTHICLLNNKNTESNDSFLVVPQNENRGATFFNRKKDEIKQIENKKYKLIKLVTIYAMMLLFNVAFSNSAYALEIGNATEFINFTNSVSTSNTYAGQTVNINADIDLNNTPLTPMDGFAGTLDGKGHKISGINITSGENRALFGKITANTVLIKNLIISGTVSGSGATCSAGFVAYVENDITFENCGNEVNVNGGEYVGGFIGKRNNKGKVKINSCYNIGNISNDASNEIKVGPMKNKHGSAGGFIGFAVAEPQDRYAEGNDIELNNVYNTGKISTSLSTGVSLGGFHGEMYNIGMVTIKNSYTAGKLVTNNIEKTGIGGTSANTDFKDQDCYYLDSTDKNAIWGAVTDTQLKDPNMLRKLNGSQNPTPWYRNDNLNNGWPILTMGKEVPEMTVSPNPLDIVYGNTGTITYTYNGDGAITAVSSASSICTVTVNAAAKTATVSAVDVGSTVVTISASKTDSYVAISKTVIVNVARKPIVVPTGTNFTYDGLQHIGLYSTEQYIAGGDYYATNVGSYTATATPTANYMWTDGSYNARNVTWNITAKSLTAGDMKATLEKNSYVYDGSPKTPGVTVTDGSKTLTPGTDYTVSYENNTNAGRGRVTVTGQGNYQGSITLEFEITRKPIAVPTGTNFTYDGTQHTGLVGTVQYTVGGTYQATKVGNYVAKATPTKNYMWTDGSYNARNVSWSITAKSFRDGSITGSLSQSTYEYDKKQKTPDITVKDGDKVLTPGVDYDVRYENNTEVGTAKVVITGKGNYEGMIEKEFTIQDTTAPSIPIVTAKINQAGGETYVSGTWTNQNIYVSLQSTDYSDIQKYQYREGTTGEWKDMPAGGVKLYDMEMNQELYYRAVDKYGNTSEASSLSVRIDKTPPEKGTLKANIRDEHGLEYEFGKVTDKSVYFRLDYLGSDQGGSELKNTTYILEEVDDNQRDHVLRTLATNEKGARTLKESGTYRVIVVTEDGAGNITRSDPYYIIIDRDFTNIIRLNNLYDVGSGIKDITITITKEGESEPTYTEQISTYEANFVKRVKLPDGTFDVNVVIQDKAGNSKTLTGKINNVIW